MKMCKHLRYLTNSSPAVMDEQAPDKTEFRTNEVLMEKEKWCWMAVVRVTKVSDHALRNRRGNCDIAWEGIRKWTVGLSWTVTS